MCGLNMNMDSYVRNTIIGSIYQCAALTSFQDQGFMVFRITQSCNYLPYLSKFSNKYEIGCLDIIKH